MTLLLFLQYLLRINSSNLLTFSSKNYLIKIMKWCRHKEQEGFIIYVQYYKDILHARKLLFRYWIKMALACFALYTKRI